MEKFAQTGLTKIANNLNNQTTIENIGITISKSLDHNRALESVGVNISNGLIIGVSIFTVGMMTSVFLTEFFKIKK
jgi:hypothetical protein